MFELVADIEQYPRFLPWCSGTRVVPEHGGGLDSSVHRLPRDPQPVHDAQPAPLPGADSHAPGRRAVPLLGRLTTTNATPSVSVRSTAGRILDGGDTGGPDITAEELGAVTTLQATGGIGTSGNALDLAVQNLVTTTTNSDQYLAELDDLASLDLNAGSGKIRLTAGGAVQDTDNTIDVRAAAFNLQATTAGTWLNPLQTQITTLTATATSGDLYFQEQDGLTVTSATATAAGGDVGVTSLTGNLLVAQITANGLVTLWAQAGAIQPTGAAAVQITARDLELSAATGIGTAATPLTIQVQRVEAAGGTGGVFLTTPGSVQGGGVSPSLLNLTGLSATSGGAIALAASDDLTLTELVQSESGPITLSAGNNLTALVGGNITSGSGAVTLTASGGALTLADGTVVNAGSGAITRCRPWATSRWAGSRRPTRRLGPLRCGARTAAFWTAAIRVGRTSRPKPWVRW